jgi:hypothetical protein
MVTTLNRSTPAREAGYEMVQYIAARVTARADAAVVRQSLGTIPAGAIIHGIINRVGTAFTGGTPLLTVGSNANADDLNATMSEAAAVEALVPLTATAGPLVNDTEFFARLSGGATAGDGYVAILFLKPLA